MAGLPCTLHRTLLRSSARQHQGFLSLGKRQVTTSTEQAETKSPIGKVQPSGSGAGYCRRHWNRLALSYKLVQAYGDAQKTRPYVTQVGSMVVIYACGDLLAQSFEGEDYDPWRMLRNMIVGCIIAIPGYKWCGSEHACQCRAGSSLIE